MDDEKRKEYSRKYYLKHRDEIIKRNKEYTNNHHEEKKAYWREYYREKVKTGKCVKCGSLIRKDSTFCKKCMFLSERNPVWKGDDVGYEALHEWIKTHKQKPKICEECHKEPVYDLANISGEYKRDISDYEWLCRKCHMTKDGRLFNKDKNGKFIRI